MLGSRIRFRALALVALVSLGLLSAASPIPRYHFVSIDVPGSTFVAMSGVTNEGLVSGSWNDSTGAGHGLLWRAGAQETVNYPGQGPKGLYLFQANDSGQVAGGYYDVAGVAHAVVYHSHTKSFERLPAIPGATANIAGGITSSGQTSGDYTDDPAQAADFVAWVYGNGPVLRGQYHDFVVPQSDQAVYGTITYCMNDALQVVGFYDDANGVSHGFIKNFGKPARVLDVPGAAGTQLSGINNVGAVAGAYTLKGVQHGFILVGGRYLTIDYPGAAQTVIGAINDFGDIAGFYVDAAGKTHGFAAALR
jgi:uncharacterized membrane protein